MGKVIPGRIIRLTINDVDLICDISCDFSFQSEMLPVSANIQGGWSEYIQGVKGWSIGLDSNTLVGLLTGVNVSYFLDNFLIGNIFKITFSTDSSYSPPFKISGNVIISSGGINASYNDISKWNTQLMGTGPFTLESSANPIYIDGVFDSNNEFDVSGYQIDEFPIFIVYDEYGIQIPVQYDNTNKKLIGGYGHFHARFISVYANDNNVYIHNTFDGNNEFDVSGYTIDNSPIFVVYDSSGIQIQVQYDNINKKLIGGSGDFYARFIALSLSKESIFVENTFDVNNSFNMSSYKLREYPVFMVYDENGLLSTIQYDNTNKKLIYGSGDFTARFI